MTLPIPESQQQYVCLVMLVSKIGRSCFQVCEQKIVGVDNLLVAKGPWGELEELGGATTRVFFHKLSI